LSLFWFRPSRETSATPRRNSCPRGYALRVGFASPLPRDVCALCVFLEWLSPSLHRLQCSPDNFSQGNLFTLGYSLEYFHLLPFYQGDQSRILHGSTVAQIPVHVNVFIFIEAPTLTCTGKHRAALWRPRGTAPFPRLVKPKENHPFTAATRVLLRLGRGLERVLPADLLGHDSRAAAGTPRRIL